MTIHPCPIPLPRYSHEQLNTLDHIGRALGQGYISWDTAVTLRDLVRTGQFNEALEFLKERGAV